MTWYDGGDAPSPERTPRAARHATEPSARTRLRAAVPGLIPPLGFPDADVPASLPATHPDAGPLDPSEQQDGAEGARAGDPPFGLPRAAGTRSLIAGARWRVPPRTAAVALLALGLIGGAVALRAAATPTAPPVTLPEPAVTATAEPDPGPTHEAVVWVHVVGQVAAPGVISLPAGSRVADALAAAGGALPEADLAALNLAAVVQDGAQVRVPAPGEEVEAAGVGDPAGGSGAPDGTIDLNTASAAELETLPGIGPVLAERVISWRSEHGPFSDVDQLQNVPGIGPAVLGQVRDRVRV